MGNPISWGENGSFFYLVFELAAAQHLEYADNYICYLWDDANGLGLVLHVLVHLKSF